MVAEARIFGPAKVHVADHPRLRPIVPDPQGAPNVYVYSPDRKRVYARRVEVGSPIGTEVEIRSGLQRRRADCRCRASRRSAKAAWLKSREVPR